MKYLFRTASGMDKFKFLQGKFPLRETDVELSWINRCNLRWKKKYIFV